MGLADLFRPRWQHSDPRVRAKAVLKIKDLDLIVSLARADVDQDVRREAQQVAAFRLGDPALIAFVRGSKILADCDIVVNQIGDAAALLAIAREHADVKVRGASWYRLVKLGSHSEGFKTITTLPANLSLDDVVTASESCGNTRDMAWLLPYIDRVEDRGKRTKLFAALITKEAQWIFKRSEDNSAYAYNDTKTAHDIVCRCLLMAGPSVDAAALEALTKLSDRSFRWEEQESRWGDLWAEDRPTDRWDVNETVNWDCVRSVARSLLDGTFDQSTIVRFARDAECEELRLAAVDRLELESDFPAHDLDNLLVGIALTKTTDFFCKIQTSAVNRLREPAALLRVAMSEAAKAPVLEAAIDRLTDQPSLMTIATQHKGPVIRERAAHRLQELSQS